MRLLYQYLSYSISLVSLFLLASCTITITPGFGKVSHTSSTAPMLRKVLPAVVNVFSEGAGRNCTDFLPKNPSIQKKFELDKNASEKCMEQSQGSGVIVNASKGYIVTNYHNVEDAARVLVTLHDRRQVAAKIIGTDPDTDLALLKITAKKLTELKLNNEDKKLETGDFLVAIGSPYGLDHSVSFGIVSALGRSGLGLEGYEDFIQTDASINVGNSGGPIVAMNGKLIGISTAIVGANNSNTGIGFAISGSMTKAIIDQLAKYGSVNRGQIGVLIDDIMVDDQLRVVITNILKNSPADKAGLKVGDIILKHNNVPILGASKLHNALGLMRVGETTTLEILRDNQTKLVVKIVLGARV